MKSGGREDGGRAAISGIVLARSAAAPSSPESQACAETAVTQAPHVRLLDGAAARAIVQAQPCADRIRHATHAFPPPLVGRATRAQARAGWGSTHVSDDLRGMCRRSAGASRPPPLAPPHRGEGESMRRLRAFRSTNGGTCTARTARGEQQSLDRPCARKGGAKKPRRWLAGVSETSRSPVSIRRCARRADGPSSCRPFPW